MQSQKNLPRLLLMTALLATVVLLLILSCLWMLRPADSPLRKTVRDALGSDEDAACAQEYAAKFMLRTHEGKIAVFSGEDHRLLEVYDVLTSSLPEADRSALASGIPLYSEDELLAILEDYTS